MLSLLHVSHRITSRQSSARQPSQHPLIFERALRNRPLPAIHSPLICPHRDSRSVIASEKSARTASTSGRSLSGDRASRTRNIIGASDRLFSREIISPVQVAEIDQLIFRRSLQIGERKVHRFRAIRGNTVAL